MPGSDMLARRLDVAALVVEKDIRPESLKKRPLIQTTEEQGFIDTNIPGAQGSHHALVRRRAASGNQRGSNHRLLGRILGLNALQGREKILEGPAHQGLARRIHLGGGKRIQAA